MFNNILVICTGNICRSPIAEAMLRNALPSKKVHSAGTGAMIGWQADSNSVAVCEEVGVSLAGHRARQINAEMIKGVDLILAMDKSHLEWMHYYLPQTRGRVHLLGKWDKNADVPDPYQLDQSRFREVRTQIEGYVQDWLKKMGVNK